MVDEAPTPKEKKPDPPAAKPQKPARSGKAKWIALLVLGVLGFASVKLGLVSFAWAQLKARAFPRDEAIFEWVPKGTRGAVVVDPHQLDQKVLGDEQSAVRKWLTRTRDDLKKATGIDVYFDVHKIVVADGLFVARGRFDGDGLKERLAEHKYVAADHAGHRLLVRAGEDAIAVVDGGDVLLYGSEAAVRASIDAEAKGEGLDDDAHAMGRLGRIGWDHAVLATVQIADDQPSLRALITGATGPRAVSFGLRTAQAVTLDLEIEAATPAAAEELAKLLEERRASAANVPGELSPVLAELAKNVTIQPDAKNGTVRVRTPISPAALDALGKALSKGGSLTQAYDMLRLVQLLAPSGT